MMGSVYCVCVCVCVCVRVLCGTVGTFPLDTTKTRLQVQGQQRDALCRQSRYRGMTHALMLIAREEGVRALYGGYVNTCICIHVHVHYYNYTHVQMYNAHA